MRSRLGTVTTLLYPLVALLLIRYFGSYLPVFAARLIKLYPTVVNGVLLIIFSLSLVRPPSIAERIARLETPDLPPRAISYTRSVTKAWCLFFVLNGLVSLATMLWASNEIWALYNGFIAYILVGTLMAIELFVRHHVRLHDPA